MSLPWGDAQQRAGDTSRKRGLELEMKEGVVFIVVASGCLVGGDLLNSAPGDCNWCPCN